MFTNISKKLICVVDQKRKIIIIPGHIPNLELPISVLTLLIIYLEKNKLFKEREKKRSYICILKTFPFYSNVKL